LSWKKNGNLMWPYYFESSKKYDTYIAVYQLEVHFSFNLFMFYSFCKLQSANKKHSK